MHAANARFRAIKTAGAKGQGKSEKPEKSKAQRLEDFIAARDFTGAVALLEFQRRLGRQIEGKPTNPWLAYALFHLGEHDKAAAVYREMIATDKEQDHRVHLYLACCLYFLGSYKEALEETKKGPADVPLQNRLLFHLALKLGDEDSLYSYHTKLTDSLEDQLCLASVHYLRNHFQEATDIYKKILLSFRDFVALNVYVALCYYKLDYYDVSSTVIDVYLAIDPDSPMAINLKACDSYRLYTGKHAEHELRTLLENPSGFGSDSVLVKHNQVVFAGGDRALQVLPPLLDVISEARLNLVIYYLKHDLVHEAYGLIADLEPQTPQEYILKAVVNAQVGSADDNQEAIRTAHRYFQLVGSSSSECDTIPGRQCMASCFFLLRHFDDVNLYLSSIKQFFEEDDTFNFNFGITRAMCRESDHQEARAAFLRIRDPKLRADYTVQAWIARCHIYCREPKRAWEQYIRMDAPAESLAFLQLLARDCYYLGLFHYSAKAFDVLERLDASPEHWEGKRGAVVGVFQQLIAGEETPETMRDGLQMLRKSAQPPQGREMPNPAIVQQVDGIVRVIRTWCQQNNVKLDLRGLD
eukprot:TRINITY_DN288_c0_g1_i2.p1 TRINITY_DN288_c0_g1~~TRINITY_DN288_c0_g1_i2.p1  ORF type:complete len:582 (-),score=148.93 TRINITY_DN288_c0_g1_i2:91-1836(-)